MLDTMDVTIATVGTAVCDYNSSYTLYEIPNLIKIIELAACLTK